MDEKRPAERAASFMKETVLSRSHEKVKFSTIERLHALLIFSFTGPRRNHHSND